MEGQQEQVNFSEVLEVAAEAGHILLENGAEISRVEDIMSRIASHYGVDSGSFFVLSNGIFTTGTVDKVAPGGGVYTLFVLDAHDESMRILGERSFVC